MMESYNDDWCQCLICFENYSVEHRPTTFICGHSVCIDHVRGNNKLEECPVCRYPLTSSNEYNISYSLEEAVRIFNALKHSMYWNNLIKKKKEEKVKIVNTKPKPVDNYETKSKLVENYNDFYEEELQRKERLLDEMDSSSDNHSLACGHKCHVSLSNICCICSIKRERLVRRPGYFVNDDRRSAQLKRNGDCCPICKKRSSAKFLFD